MEGGGARPQAVVVKTEGRLEGEGRIVTLVRLLPVVLATWLLGAHFFRSGSVVLAACSALAPALLFVKRSWVARGAQAFLALAAMEWFRTMALLVGERQRLGLPVTRLSLILGGVAVLTLASALVFRGAALRKRYSLS
jgi:hypothetical protein